MAEQIREALQVLRMKQLRARVGLAPSTIYLKISQGIFPRPISLGSPHVVGWLEHEVNAWLASQAEQRDKAVA